MTLDFLQSRATVSVAVAARALSLGQSTTYRLLERGDLPGLRLGSRWVVPTRGLLRMLGVTDAPAETPALDQASSARVPVREGIEPDAEPVSPIRSQRKRPPRR